MIDEDGVVDIVIFEYRPVCKLCNAGADFDGVGVDVGVDMVVVGNGIVTEEKLGKGDRVDDDCTA